MRKDWKYILYLGIAFGIFLLLKMFSPKQYDWTITLLHDDKNPYGTYALDKLMPTIFEGHDINHSYQTIYEIKDSLKRSGSFVTIALTFTGDEPDTKALLRHVADGGSAFISAHYFTGPFSDTLGLSTKDYFWSDGAFQRADTATIEIVNPNLDTTEEFYFKREDTHNYFNAFDITRTTVIARNDQGKPVTIRVRWGKGNLILNTTPLAFTNIYILSKENHRFVSSMLSYLPQTDIEWSEYYHAGSHETGDVLRYLLITEPLTWAYYLTVLSILLFMIFEMKRKQRIIPIIKPLENTTLEFVRTIGNLYFQSGEHKAVAEKKVNYFLDHVRTKYWLQSPSLDEQFIIALSLKSGRSEADVRKLITAVRFVQSQTQIGVDQLVDLNERLENFYYPPKY